MFSIIQAAGWPIWPLLVASILALALIIERSMALRPEKILPHTLVGEVLNLHRQKLITHDILGKLESNSPLGRVLAAALRYERANRDILKESVEEAGRAAAHELERFLTTLGTIASTAPLMGLFGTVIGMIEIFGAQGPGGTSPQELAHGISVALYNTAFGLVIAIPTLIAYRHFRAKVDSFVVEMEQRSIHFIDNLQLLR